MANYGICSVAECGKAAQNRKHQLCSMHLARLRRGGSLALRMPIRTVDDLLGGQSRFGSWTVHGEGEPYRRKTADGSPHPFGPQRTATCECECGTIRNITIQTLKSGRSNHCGCRNGEMNSALHGTHLMSGSPEHRSWAHMKERCLNPDCGDYPNYGGRGITVCDRWRDFQSFYDDMGPRPSAKHSIDRIDVDRGYSPGNCRWATVIEQAQNKRATRWVLFRGERMAMMEACRRAGLEAKYKIIHARVHKRGLTLEQAMAAEGVPLNRP